MATAEVRREQVTQDVIKIVADIACVPLNELRPESWIVADLRIEGDDGDDLIRAMDSKFSIDWSELDAGIIFGNEPPGSVPPIWFLIPNKYSDGRWNAAMYERQDRQISDLVSAALLGKWTQPEPVLKSNPAKKYVLAQSLFSTGWFLLSFVILIACLVSWVA